MSNRRRTNVERGAAKEDNDENITSDTAVEGDDVDAFATESNGSNNSTTQIRVGTWNVLCPDDEYNDEYGCPLQIALCETIESDDQVLQERRDECTRARYRRVWQRLDEQAPRLDVVALQEVTDDFTSLQPTDSQWSIIQQSGECGLWLSRHSNMTVLAVWDVALPSLSGCPSMPMAIMAHGNTTTTVYIVGSVHVKASVTNMNEWYNVSADLIRQSTASALNALVTTPSETAFEPMNATEMSWIIAGDFNHNLTDDAPPHWQLVYDTTTADLGYGTSQKEDNWMGIFDGFWVSSPYTYNASRDSNDSTTTDLAFLPRSCATRVTQVQAHVEGFMPKVVLHLPQGGIVSQRAQFAMVHTVTGTPVSLARLPEWNINEWHLVFDASSHHAHNHTRVPRSNPRTQALSDHLFVTATIDSASTTRYIPPLVQSSSNRLSGWVIILSLMGVVTALAILVVWRRRKSTSHPRYGGIGKN